jgi:hypothetical protein
VLSVWLNDASALLKSPSREAFEHVELERCLDEKPDRRGRIEHW